MRAVEYLLKSHSDELWLRLSCLVWSISVSSQVLATGLSALYSSLPRKIEVRGDDWHALRREDWMCVSSLVLFMNSLEFCNAVVQVAHPLVRHQLLDYLHNGFLIPVMGPALHKVDEGWVAAIRSVTLDNHTLSCHQFTLKPFKAFKPNQDHLSYRMTILCLN